MRNNSQGRIDTRDGNDKLEDPSPLIIRRLAHHGPGPGGLRTRCCRPRRLLIRGRGAIAYRPAVGILPARRLFVKELRRSLALDRRQFRPSHGCCGGDLAKRR